jgi:hypothetical protein
LFGCFADDWNKLNYGGFAGKFQTHGDIVRLLKGGQSVRNAGKGFSNISFPCKRHSGQATIGGFEQARAVVHSLLLAENSTGGAHRIAGLSRHSHDSLNPQTIGEHCSIYAWAFAAHPHAGSKEWALSSRHSVFDSARGDPRHAGKIEDRHHEDRENPRGEGGKSGVSGRSCASILRAPTGGSYQRAEARDAILAAEDHMHDDQAE